MMPQKREQSMWIFAIELRDSTVLEKNDEWTNSKPVVITPLGTRLRRILVNGIVTQKSTKDNMGKITISDGTGNFYVSAFDNDFNRPGKQELDEFQINDPVLVMGRVGSFSANDRIYFNINPEMIIKSDTVTQEFWNSRARYVAMRKIYAIREASKDGGRDKDALISKGYSAQEAECAIRSLLNYPNYDIQNFERVISSTPPPTKVDEEKIKMKDAVISYIKNNDDNGKGCRYEDVAAASKLLGFPEDRLDELLNELGSDGEIYEASLKRYRTV